MTMDETTPLTDRLAARLADEAHAVYCAALQGLIARDTQSLLCSVDCDEMARKSVRVWAQARKQNALIAPDHKFYDELIKFYSQKN